MSLSFIQLYSNALNVLKSKDSSVPKYLTSQGELSSNPQDKATIVDYVMLVKKHLEPLSAEIKKWKSLTKAIISVIKCEACDKTAYVFAKMVTPLGDLKYKNDFSQGMEILKNTSSWISQACMQDLFMEVAVELKRTEAKILEESKKLDPVISNYFSFFKPKIRIKALSAILAHKPKSLSGEILFEKLKAQKDEYSIHMPFEHVDTRFVYDFSRDRVIAFSQKEFIEELKKIYPDCVDGLDEVHDFCKILLQFAKVYFIYLKRVKLEDHLMPFFTKYLGFLEKTIKEKAKESIDLDFYDLKDVVLTDYSLKFAELMFESAKERIEKADRSKLDGNRFNFEADIKPCLDLFTTYDADHRPFLMALLDPLHKLNRDIFEDMTSRFDMGVIGEILEVATKFDPDLLCQLDHFKGPQLDEKLPNSDAWRAYIKKLEHYLCPTIEHFFNQDYRSKLKDKLEDELKEVAHRAEASPELLELAPPKDIKIQKTEYKSIRPDLSPTAEEKVVSQQVVKKIFSETKVIKALDLFADIGKQPMTFSYAPRVYLWFDAPEEALKVSTYKHLHSDVKKRMVKVHAFSPHVDLFINSHYSHRFDRYNEKTKKIDDLYLIPGSLTYADKSMRGFFEYTIDKVTSVCYHRYFRDVPPEIRLNDYLDMPQDREDSEYPSLSCVKNVKDTKLVAPDGSITVTKDSIDRISFGDPATGMTISLFKLR